MGFLGISWWVQVASVCWSRRKRTWDKHRVSFGATSITGEPSPRETAASPVLTPCAKPWALALQVTSPHLYFFQELLPTTWCWLWGVTSLHVPELTASSSPWERCKQQARATHRQAAASAALCGAWWWTHSCWCMLQDPSSCSGGPHGHYWSN